MKTTIILASTKNRLTDVDIKGLHKLNENIAKEAGFSVVYKEPCEDSNVARRLIYAYTQILRHEKVNPQYQLPPEWIDVFGSRTYSKEEADFIDHFYIKGVKQKPYVAVMVVKKDDTYYYCWRVQKEN